MKTKSIKIQYKEVGNNDTGRICGYASTYDRVPDSYGDIVAKGAFTDTLKKWEQSEKSIPFLENHKADDFEFNIGYVDVIKDTDKGLYFEAVFDDTPRAQRARKLYKEGRITQFSFAYDVLDAEEITLEDGTKAYELRKLEIYEISAVTIPANQFADVVEVKGGNMAKKEFNPENEREQEKMDDLSLRDKFEMFDDIVDDILDITKEKIKGELKAFIDSILGENNISENPEDMPEDGKENLITTGEDEPVDDTEESSEDKACGNSDDEAEDEAQKSKSRLEEKAKKLLNSIDSLK